MAPAGRCSTASSTRRRCSSVDSVDASPVVPHTTSPSVPLAYRWPIRSTKAFSSTEPSRANGVTMAVRTAPRLMAFRLPDRPTRGLRRVRPVDVHRGRALARAPDDGGGPLARRGSTRGAPCGAARAGSRRVRPRRRRRRRGRTPGASRRAPRTGWSRGRRGGASPTTAPGSVCTSPAHNAVGRERHLAAHPRRRVALGELVAAEDLDGFAAHASNDVRRSQDQTQPGSGRRARIRRDRASARPRAPRPARSTDASMRSREKSLMSRPWTISNFPFDAVTGNDDTRPSGTP